MDAIGHVQTTKQDAALLALYDALRARGAPKPGSFSSLTTDDKREYYRLARRRSRARERGAKADGRIEPSAANIRDALADAALMILATDAAGADQVRAVLGAVFAARPGVPMAVEQKAKRGRLRPKLIARPSGGQGQ